MKPKPLLLKRNPTATGEKKVAYQVIKPILNSSLLDVRDQISQGLSDLSLWEDHEGRL